MRHLQDFHGRNLRPATPSPLPTTIGTPIVLLLITFAPLLAGCSNNTSCWHRTELFFGGNRPDGAVISDVEWRHFVDTRLTPAFPAGLTVLHGEGQWREEDGAVTREASRIVVLLYPEHDATPASSRINELVSDYCHAFHQDSVLRTDRRETATFPTSMPVTAVVRHE